MAWQGSGLALLAGPYNRRGEQHGTAGGTVFKGLAQTGGSLARDRHSLCAYVAGFGTTLELQTHLVVDVALLQQRGRRGGHVD